MLPRPSEFERMKCGIFMNTHAQKYVRAHERRRTRTHTYMHTRAHILTRQNRVYCRRAERRYARSFSANHRSPHFLKEALASATLETHAKSRSAKRNGQIQFLKEAPANKSARRLRAHHRAILGENGRARRTELGPIGKSPSLHPFCCP